MNRFICQKTTEVKNKKKGKKTAKSTMSDNAESKFTLASNVLPPVSIKKK